MLYSTKFNVWWIQKWFSQVVFLVILQLVVGVLAMITLTVLITLRQKEWEWINRASEEYFRTACRQASINKSTLKPWLGLYWTLFENRLLIALVYSIQGSRIPLSYIRHHRVLLPYITITEGPFTCSSQKVSLYVTNPKYLKHPWHQNEKIIVLLWSRVGFVVYS